MNGIGAACAALAAALVAVSVPSAWAASLEVVIDPSEPKSPFEIEYLQTFTIKHGGSGEISDLLSEGWSVTIDNSNAPAEDIAALEETLNSNILGAQSQVRISDVELEYKASATVRQNTADINYKINISGSLGNYIITDYDRGSPGIIDMGWRQFTIPGPVIVAGIDINTPMSALEDRAPELAGILRGTEAADVFERRLMQPDDFADKLDRWHFLIDPTGISVDAERFGISDEIAGKVVSSYTLGESSIREGRKVDEVIDRRFTADKEYTLSTILTVHTAEISVVGYTTIDSLDDLEILGFDPNNPIGQTTSTGNFPALIIYGMAGMAAVGAVAFFIISNRQLKKEQGVGQTGIDPAHLTANATSTAAGSYQTNRGEATLRTDYADTSQSSRELSEGGDARGGAMPKGWKKE